MMNGAVALTKTLYGEGRIDGVLSIGGAQGTIIGTSAMRSLPLGVPKSCFRRWLRAGVISRLTSAPRISP